MLRVLVISAALTAAALFCPPATAEPATAYMIGRCYDPSQSVQERPAEVVYGCDSTGVMKDMAWTSWGADGAQGTGTDDSVECQPYCAVGEHLVNPIVVHAWNPASPTEPGCPADVQFYRDITIAYPKDVPPWVKPGTTWGDDTEFIEIDGMPAVHYFDQKPYSCSPLS
jgi:hypothetical protein